MSLTSRLKSRLKTVEERSVVPSVLDVPPNDLDEALRVYDARKRAGVLSEADIRVLGRGFEDAEEFLSEVMRREGVNFDEES